MGEPERRKELDIRIQGKQEGLKTLEDDVQTKQETEGTDERSLAAVQIKNRLITYFSIKTAFLFIFDITYQ